MQNGGDDPGIDGIGSRQGLLAKGRSGTKGHVLPTKMWLVIVFALVLSVTIGLFEVWLSPVAIDQRVFSTVNITVEILRVTFAFGVFGVVWLTRRFSLGLRKLIIAMTFLAVGVFTIFRLLTFPQMPSMAAASENIGHTLYFSVFLRYTIGAALLATAFVRKDSQASARETWILLAATAVYLTSVIVIVLIPGSPLPDLQTNGATSTPLYVELEYGSMALSFFAAIGYARLAVSQKDTRYTFVAIGLILFAQAGFAFMESPSSEDLVFLIGRSTALTGFFLIFIAIMKISLFSPYAELERATRDSRDTKTEVERKSAELRVLAQDLTEMKRAEEALRDSERMLFRFLVDLPVGIVVSDPKGGYLFSNDRARQILGKDVDPTMPIGETTAFHQACLAGTDEPYPRDRDPILRALKGETSMVDDVEIRKPYETLRIEVWGAPVTDQDGNVLYGIAAFQDITERKESETLIIDLNRSLEVQKRRLEDINRELEAFSYSVSHDLRAPLRTMDGFSNILLDHYAGVLDEKGGDYLKRIRAGCQRMGQLIDDMLKLSRITRDEIQWGEVDLSKLTNSVLAEMKKAQPERKVKLVIEDGVLVHGDERLYRILMTNLLENAWKFSEMQPKPVIQFGVSTIRGEKVYFVKDNGAGFDMKHSDKLFMPFQRLHSTAEFAGTGIGLATAQRIVHRHGGKIWAEGEVGKGATFYFTEGQREATAVATT